MKSSATFSAADFYGELIAVLRGEWQSRLDLLGPVPGNLLNTLLYFQTCTKVRSPVKAAFN